MLSAIFTKKRYPFYLSTSKLFLGLLYNEVGAISALPGCTRMFTACSPV